MRFLAQRNNDLFRPTCACIKTDTKISRVEMLLKKIFYYIHIVWKVSHLDTGDFAAMLIHAFCVTSRLYYCNVVYVGLLLMIK